MALDFSDLLEPPYHFGETSVIDKKVFASCDCFKENVLTEVRVVKRGNWVNVNIPNVLTDARTDFYSTGFIEIPSFLDKECLGEYPRIRYFSCICYAFDPVTKVAKAYPGLVTMDEKGNIKINPGILSETLKPDSVTKTVNSYFTCDPECKGKIGCLSINFSYIVDDLHSLLEEIKLNDEVYQE